MRVTFAETLAELAASDRRIVLLTGDVGFMALDAFTTRHPDRFFNAGVAEQNMVGLATGLAEAGFIPFVYSIAPFAVLRPYEFIRNGPVQHGLPVRIVGVGAGMEYGTNGFSHYGLDDIAVTRTHPNLSVLAPADFQQTRSILLATWDRAGPIYYRLGKDQQTVVPGLDGRFAWDEPVLVRDGRDVLLITTSSIAAEVAIVADQLGASGVSAAFAVVAQVNPPPADALASLMRRFRLICSVENHFPNGGFGSMIAEIATDHAIGCPVLRIGASGNTDGRSGSTAFMHRHRGISPEQVFKAVRAALGPGPMTPPDVSVILPFCNQADYVAEIVKSHAAMLSEAGIAHEIILVPNGSTDRTNAVCRALAAEMPRVRCLEIEGRGWGRAVRSGVAAAAGTIICYTNSARTQPDDLKRILDCALQNPGAVVKAARVSRDGHIRRIGSFLYNALCGALLRLSTRDVNGTPKAFPQSASTLRNLQREDDLIDLEFMWRCARASLTVVEIPVDGGNRRGGRSTTGFKTAWRLYTGAIGFWRQVAIESRDR